MTESRTGAAQRREASRQAARDAGAAFQRIHVITNSKSSRRPPPSLPVTNATASSGWSAIRAATGLAGALSRSASIIRRASTSARRAWTVLPDHAVWRFLRAHSHGLGGSTGGRFARKEPTLADGNSEGR